MKISAVIVLLGLVVMWATAEDDIKPIFRHSTARPRPFDETTTTLSPVRGSTARPLSQSTATPQRDSPSTAANPDDAVTPKMDADPAWEILSQYMTPDIWGPALWILVGGLVVIAVMATMHLYCRKLGFTCTKTPKSSRKSGSLRGNSEDDKGDYMELGPINTASTTAKRADSPPSRADPGFEPSRFACEAQVHPPPTRNLAVGSSALASALTHLHAAIGDLKKVYANVDLQPAEAKQGEVARPHGGEAASLLIESADSYYSEATV